MEKCIQIPALRLTQWLEAWDSYRFDPDIQRRKPEPHMYMFSMPAGKLCEYSDVYRRERSTEDAEGIQRERDVSRTERIRRYINAGYPFGDLKPVLQETHAYLKNPGWLPTAMVVNLLTENDQRKGKKIKREHVARLIEDRGQIRIQLPDQDSLAQDDLRPFEVVDGQHRLWAFSRDVNLSDFEVPVVAFQGLDVAWQAYLFWSINITPVRINPSHAFDLYPLLRTQDWLEDTGEIAVYREARAQEITEGIYRHPSSPWHNRISMLQRKGEARVSQAAWIRSLIRSFFGTGKGKGRHGLFQSALDNSHIALEWERVQQIAFIIEFWAIIREELAESREEWVTHYLNDGKNPFTDRTSMLNQDIGVQATHAALNDIFYHHAHKWNLRAWRYDAFDKTVATEHDIEQAINSLRVNDLHYNLKLVAKAMCSFDWRSFQGPNVRCSEDEMTKRAYRGSGGYTLLTNHILEHVFRHTENAVFEDADKVLTA